MRGPSAVIALVLAETAAGATAVLWVAPLWGAVKRGFFVLTGTVAFGCAVLGAWALSAARDQAAGSEAGTAVLLTSITAAVLGLSTAALLFRLDVAGRILGLLSVLTSVAMLGALAGAAGPPDAVALFQLVAGATFMGAVTDGLLLGHWYLTDRRLSRDHIQRLSLLLIGAVVLEAVAIVAGGFGTTPSPGTGFNPILSLAGLASWLALGMAAATALVAVLIRMSLRGARPRAVQAATGFFYLAVITAFTAEMAAKIGFVG